MPRRWFVLSGIIVLVVTSTAVAVRSFLVSPGGHTMNSAGRSSAGPWRMPAGSQRSTMRWRVVPSVSFHCDAPVVGQYDITEGRLNDVAATGPDDAWAVGVCGDDSGTRGGYGRNPQGEVEHWDGKRWSAARIPGGAEYDLVAAGSPENVWAAGAPSGEGAPLNALAVIHWGGRRWTSATAGLPSSARITAVSATPTTAWSLVNRSDSGDGTAKVFRWNGSRWAQVNAPKGFHFKSGDGNDPTRTGDGFLTADKTGGVWVGGSLGRQATRPAIAHYNGSGWNIEPLPIPRRAGLLGIGMTGNGVWAVAEAVGITTGGRAPAGIGAVFHPGRTFAERWDGAHWKRLPPPPGIGLGQVFGDGFGHVWVSGSAAAGGNSIWARWDGQRWETGKSGWPPPYPPDSNLSSEGRFIFAPVPGSSAIWGVGVSRLLDGHPEIVTAGPP